MTERFVCPECGFRIFNRRVARCERCRAALPRELLFTAEEMAALDAQHEQSNAERIARKEAEREKQSDKAGIVGVIGTIP